MSRNECRGKARPAPPPAAPEDASPARGPGACPRMEMKEKRMAVHAPTKRVTDILNFLAREGRPCTLSEISRGVNSPVSTCSVILRTLVQENFLECSGPAHLYSLGFGVYALSSAFMAPRTVLRSVLSEMHRVVDVCGEICELGILDGQDVFYIAKVESQDPIRIVSQVGMRLPACCTATGKALLADFSEEDLHRLYGDTLPTVTAHSLTSFSELASQLQAIREGHLARGLRESSREATSYALPLRFRGSVAASISVSVPLFRMSEEKEEVVGRELRKAKSKIEALMESRGECIVPLNRSGKNITGTYAPRI